MRKWSIKAPSLSGDSQTDRTPRGKQIPEAFIWVIFRGLVEALHLLLTGEAPDPDAVQQNPPQFLSNQDLRHTYPHWEPVVHRDIKVQNVVLSTSTEQYPAFKTPKLIDFGLAIRTQTHGTAGKMEMGTPAFMAPVCAAIVDILYTFKELIQSRNN